MSRSNKQLVFVLTAELLCRKRENLPVRRHYRLFCPRAENKRRKELIKGEIYWISDRKSGLNNYTSNCPLRYLLHRRLHILLLFLHLGFLRHGRARARTDTLSRARTLGDCAP